MAESWWLVLAAVSSVVGMSALALAKEAHWRLVQSRARRPERVLQGVGVLAVLLSLGLCLRADFPSIAVLVWVMLLSVSALAVAMLLAWRARWLSGFVTLLLLVPRIWRRSRYPDQ